MKLSKVLSLSLITLISCISTFSYAEDDHSTELGQLKTALSKMQSDMNMLKNQFDQEREELRDSTGGAPEALRTKGNNATVQIGGTLAVRYYADFRYNYKKAGSNRPAGGEYADRMGWDFDTPSVTFNIAMNDDLGAFIDIRPNKFDKAYFYWNNIAGSGLGTEVGYIGVPGGMYSSSFNPWGNVFITNPGTKSFSFVYSAEDRSASDNPNDDIKRMGIKLHYTKDQYIITGTIFSDTDLGAPNDLLQGYDADDSSSILSNNGDVRNNGVMNHSLMFEYMPAFVEGLNFALTYIGNIDTGQGVSTQAGRRGTSYNPQFDIGAAYIQDKYALYIEADYNLGRSFYSDTSAWCVSVGGDYAITEKFKIAAGGDIGVLSTSNELYKTVITNTNNTSHIESTNVRGRIAALYKFDCGMWYKLEYDHIFFNTSGVGDSGIKSRDSVVFEAGVAF